MSYLTIALIIVLIVIIIPLIFITMNNYQLKKSKEKMFVFFSNLGAGYDLSFTVQEIFRDKIIGLDGPQKKVLIIEQHGKRYSSQMIDLYEVKSCKVKKNYTAINSDGYKKNSAEDHLTSIALEFDFKTERSPVEVVFYSYGNDSLYELRELETKTKHWEIMISKILPIEEQKSA